MFGAVPDSNAHRGEKLFTRYPHTFFAVYAERRQMPPLIHSFHSGY